MGIRSFLGLTESSTSGDTVETAAWSNQVEILQESLADLELALEDQGWDRILGNGTEEFTRPGLGRAAALARVMAVQNPLIRRALAIRQAYVWGSGVQVFARAGEDAEQDVNAVVQAFLADPLNRRALTGEQAQEELERALGTDGNIFIALVTRPLTGQVQVRTIPFDEITEIRSNPEDKVDVWFYRRVWSPAGSGQQREELYPDIHYQPESRPVTVDGLRVNWDKPVHHVKVNGLRDWQFGIGDAYPALSWARAYKEFLGDWATLVKALSRFAWRTTSKGSKAQAMREKLAAAPSTSPTTGQPLAAGATAVTSADVTLEAIPKTGATIDSESGKPLAAMSGTAMDVPVTMLLGDPGQTGARATAETLDKPLELASLQRRSLWTNAYLTMLTYVIDQSIKAPRGALRGTVAIDRDTRRATYTLAGDVDRTIEMVWGDLTSTPVDVLVAAIVNADSTQRLPAETVARLLLQALGVDDVDDLIEDMLDDHGNFVDPAMNAAHAAITRNQRGQDPELEPGPENEDG